ncbi:MAG: aspartate aminotransferase family protein [Acidimicrobiia bacterium]
MSAVFSLPVPEPAPSSAEWLARDAAALAGVLPRCSDVVAVRGSGSWLYDADGRRYLDFASGIAVNNTGHCHPAVVAAIAEQAATLIHTSVVTHHPRSIELAERMGELCPFFAGPQVFLCNSGAEAVDGSLKLARRATGRGGVVAFRRAFHGRTLAATSLTTAKAKYQEGYQPLLPSVHVAPYGEDLDTLDELLSDDIGAVIVEPVLGEGGYLVPPAWWLAGLRERCDGDRRLLIFDEVQCGMGRTGYPFAAETFGVTPDVLLFAKGVASGMPMGGIVAPRALMERWPTGAHGSTFGGNPVACAAALATIDVLAPLYGRVRALGSEALSRLSPWGARGVGLMIGVELGSAEEAAAVQARCLDDGLIVLVCGPGENVLRLIPPLTITDDEFEAGLTILERALRDA